MENRGLKLLLRQHKLSNTGIKEWFSQFLIGLETITDEEQPNSVFYEKDGETLFELYYEKNGSEVYFFVHNDKIWKVFKTKFGIGDNDTQSFIKNVVEDKLGSVIPYMDCKRWRQVEDTLKLVPITPLLQGHLQGHLQGQWVEDTLK